MAAGGHQSTPTPSPPPRGVGAQPAYKSGRSRRRVSGRGEASSSSENESRRRPAGSAAVCVWRVCRRAGPGERRRLRLSAPGLFQQPDLRGRGRGGDEGSAASSRCCVQVGERSFPLEAVKQLKLLSNLDRGAGPHLTEASVAAACAHPLLPQVFRPVCQGKSADIILSRLGKSSTRFLELSRVF